METSKSVGTIGVADIGRVGATVRPIYGERRPVTYHVFETELMTITALNSHAISQFSIGSALAAFVANILIAFTFSGDNVGDIGKFLFHYVSWICGTLAAAFYGFGILSLRQKKSLIDQIKRETKQSVDEGTES